MMKVTGYKIDRDGGWIEVKSSRRYRRGGWSRDSLRTAPLHDLAKLLRSAGVETKKQRGLDLASEAPQLRGGRYRGGPSFEICHDSEVSKFAGEILNEGRACAFLVTPAWRDLGDDWGYIEAIPEGDALRLLAALEKLAENA